MPLAFVLQDELFFIQFCFPNTEDYNTKEKERAVENQNTPCYRGNSCCHRWCSSLA